jgi:hypothetical protein
MTGESLNHGRDERGERMPYEPPSLKVLGTVAELTLARAKAAGPHDPHNPHTS